jgi:hypothetical protein
MKMDLEQPQKPNLPFLRKWVKLQKEEFGYDSEIASEMQKCLLYVRFLQDRVEQLELYNECFQRILKQDEECQTKQV